MVVGHAHHLNLVVIICLEHLHITASFVFDYGLFDARFEQDVHELLEFDVFCRDLGVATSLPILRLGSGLGRNLALIRSRTLR